MRLVIYRLHRSLSIVIAIPVLLWASSGFMHPLMTNLRPAIATQGIPPSAVDSQKIRIPLAAALQRHHMDSLFNFRLVHIDTSWFYQVQAAVHGETGSQGRGGVPIYISCTNGNVLPAGDWLYAQYLARQFLEGPMTKTRPQAEGMTMAMTMAKPAEGKGGMDCCGAATDCVLNPVKGAKVTNVSLLRDFDNEYKSINRLLPVYRVSFERADGIRVYVETTQDRFSFAMDNRRAIFDEIFRLCHTWGWLDFLGRGRLIIELLFAFTALLTALMGIYIFFTTRSKKVNGNKLVKARRNHRYTAITASLFTLLWTFSGSYHAFTKLTKPDTRDRYAVHDNFPIAVADVDYGRLQAIIGRPVANISFVKMDGQTYWRVTALPAEISVHKDLMKDNMVAFSPVCYIRSSDYSLLPDGDARYADWLATLWSGHPAGGILSTSPVTSFGDEYNFTDKRLPVWKISYSAHSHERFYVETCSGKLASYVNDQIAAEGYSFSVFHKHHFMDWGGKTVRDGSTMFWALAQVIMIVIGLTLWFTYRRRRTLQRV